MQSTFVAQKKIPHPIRVIDLISSRLFKGALDYWILLSFLLLLSPHTTITHLITFGAGHFGSFFLSSFFCFLMFWPLVGPGFGGQIACSVMHWYGEDLTGGLFIESGQSVWQATCTVHIPQNDNVHESSKSSH